MGQLEQCNVYQLIYTKEVHKKHDRSEVAFTEVQENVYLEVSSFLPSPTSPSFIHSWTD